MECGAAGLGSHQTSFCDQLLVQTGCLLRTAPVTPVRKELKGTFFLSKQLIPDDAFSQFETERMNLFSSSFSI